MVSGAAASRPRLRFLGVALLFAALLLWACNSSEGSTPEPESEPQSRPTYPWDDTRVTHLVPAQGSVGDPATLYLNECRPDFTIDVLIDRQVRPISREWKHWPATEGSTLPPPDPDGLFAWETEIPDRPAGLYSVVIRCEPPDTDAVLGSEPTMLVIEGEYEDAFRDDDRTSYEAAFNAAYAWGIIGPCAATDGLCNPPKIPPGSLNELGCKAETPYEVCPEVWMQRWELVEYIYRTLFPLPSRDSPSFETAYTANLAPPFGLVSMNALAALGIDEGCGNGDFCGWHRVTRGQAAEMLARAFLDPDPVGPPAAFEDLGPSLENELSALLGAGVLTNCDSAGVRFCPDADLTRGEAMAWLVALRGIGDPDDLPTASELASESSDRLAGLP